MIYIYDKQEKNYVPHKLHLNHGIFGQLLDHFYSYLDASLWQVFCKPSLFGLCLHCVRRQGFHKNPSFKKRISIIQASPIKNINYMKSSNAKGASKSQILCNMRKNCFDLLV